MTISRSRRFGDGMRGLALTAAMCGLAACQDEVIAVGEDPNDTHTPDEGDASADDGSPLSGTLYSFSNDGSQLLHVAPETGKSTVVMTFPDAGDYIGERSIVVDPVAHTLVVYRYDFDLDAAAITVVDQQTGAVNSRVSTDVLWMSLGRIETTGQIVGVAVGLPDAESYAVASLDPATGAAAVLAAKPFTESMGGMVFDGVSTFSGGSTVSQPDDLMAYTLIDTATAEQTTHVLGLSLWSGFVIDPDSRRMLATTSTLPISLAGIDIDTQAVTWSTTLPGDIDFANSGAFDRASKRYYAIAGTSESAFEVLTIDTDTGHVTRHPVLGPTPTFPVVFSP